MKIENLPVGQLKAYDKNAKKHEQKQIDQVAESIKRFGFIQPIVIDKDDVVVIGHCRLASALKLGLETVPAVRVDNLTPDEVKALRLADNKLNESVWNMELIMDELKDMGADLINITGFDDSLAMVGNRLGGIENDDIEIDRIGVITLMPPESPKLVEKAILYVDDIELYKKLKEAILDNKFSGNDLISLL